MSQTYICSMKSSFAMITDNFLNFVYTPDVCLYLLCRNIIDVAAMDSHNLEPQELNDRIRLYSHKLSQQWGTLQDETMSVANGIQSKIYFRFVFRLSINMNFSFEFD